MLEGFAGLIVGGSGSRFNTEQARALHATDAFCWRMEMQANSMRPMKVNFPPQGLPTGRWNTLRCSLILGGVPHSQSFPGMVLLTGESPVALPANPYLSPGVDYPLIGTVRLFALSVPEPSAISIWVACALAWLGARRAAKRG